MQQGLITNTPYSELENLIKMGDWTRLFEPMSKLRSLTVWQQQEENVGRLHVLFKFEQPFFKTTNDHCVAFQETVFFLFLGI